ncbi:hypothetical protein Slin14017_G027270 [Septoria linicola]|nr:hypothetical protein Slin14017_G027270 [Septoria linicola]
MLSAISSLIFGQRSAKRRRGDSDSNVEPPAKRSKTTRQTSLKDLPLELREEIYRCLLDDTIDRPQHPYCNFPGSDGHAQFSDYLAMRLVDRDTSYEMKNIWEKEFASRAVFYLEDAPALYRLRVMANRIPYLAETARFCLRCRSDDPACPGERDRINEDIAMLIEDQPGRKEEWDDEPGLLNEVLYEDNDELFFHTNDDPWDAEAHGFQIVDHEACELGKRLGITQYKEVIYPVIQNSIQMRGFSWQLEFPIWHQGHSEIDKETLGCTYLEGRICDVSFRGYSPRRCAKHLIHHQWELKQMNSETCGKDYDEYRERLRSVDSWPEVARDLGPDWPDWELHARISDEESIGTSDEDDSENSWQGLDELDESEGDESSEESE